MFPGRRTAAPGQEVVLSSPLVQERQAVELTNTQATRLLEHWLGGRVACKSIVPLEGGICSSVFRLQFDRPPYWAVVKLRRDPSDDPLPRERVCLDYLRRHTSVPCPEVYLQDSSCRVIPYPFLLLERLPGVNFESAQLQPAERITIERELAEALLDLHSHTRDTFGDFGEGPGESEWVNVFMPRLEDIRRDMDDFLPAEILAEVDRSLPFAEAALREQGTPTLVHNDVWAGNIMVEQRRDGWHLSGLLDPVGLRYADVEMELAYLQAFDTVGQTFFDEYTSPRPLRPGYEFRRLFYWLHTYMLHVWLGFGVEFHDRIASTAKQAMSLAPKSSKGGRK